MPAINRYGVLLFLLVLGYGLFEYYRPKPLDWRITYSNKDKIPFGTKAIFQLLPEVWASEDVKTLRIPPYNHLQDTSRLQTPSSYLFINTSFAIDLNDQASLLRYVADGNTVFISAYHFPDSLMKSLGVAAKEHRPTPNDTAQYVNFVNPKLALPKGTIFPKDDGRNYFQINDKRNTILLATNERKEAIFIKTHYGKGHFFLHCLPVAFTNYYVLDSITNPHAFRALSYLPRQPVYWDEYQKQGRFGANESSIFRYIATEPALQVVYYLTLSGLLLYALFAGKRTQRIIPVMAPPRNAMLEFVQTIGTMYYKKGDHSNLSDKLTQHFYWYLNERFSLHPLRLSEAELQDELNHRSGLPQEEISTLLDAVFAAKKKGDLSADELKYLNHQLEEFYKKTR